MTVIIAGPADAVTSAVPEGRSVRRVTTLAAARDALPSSDIVLVSDRFAPGADTLLGIVRSGVHCPAVTPVVRVIDGRSDPAGWPADPWRHQSGFDAVVHGDDPVAVRSALTLADRAEAYRDAVGDLYEACRTRAAGEADDGTLDEAFRRADRAFDDVRDAAGRTPYEQLLGSSTGRADDGRASDPAEESETADEA